MTKRKYRSLYIKDQDLFFCRTWIVFVLNLGYMLNVDILFLSPSDNDYKGYYVLNDLCFY